MNEKDTGRLVTSTRWYWSDWMSDPGLRACGYAARGLWQDLLCIAGSNKHDYGFVSLNGRKLEAADIATMTSCRGPVGEVETLLAELETNGVFSRDRRGIIYCRRMVRAEKNRKNGRLGGRPKPTETQRNPVSRNPLLPIPNISKKKESKTPRRVKPIFESDWPVDYRERWWHSYPKKTEKLAALKKLDAIHRAGRVPWATMTAGLLRYASAVMGWEERYIKQPTRWLENGCWDDEYKSEPNGRGQNGKDQQGGGRSRGGGFGVLAARLRQKRDSGDVGEDATAAAVREGDGPGHTGPVLDLVVAERR